MAHKASAIGRIRQLGLDTVTNYSFLSTSAYDATDPAATTAALAANENLFYDQALYTLVPPGSEFAHEGLLLTFERRMAYSWGCLVKVRPSYNDAIANATAIELWSHDSQADEWTLRRRIVLADPFSGVPSGEAKFFDFRFAVQRPFIDKLWVTMAPDPADSPTMRFVAVHPFGQCHLKVGTPGDCKDDPTVDCIDDGGGCDPVTGDGCVPPLDCSGGDPPAICVLPPFDWPRVGQPVGGNPGPSDPPDTPLVDLCDPTALAAFKASMTPDQLSYFEELLSHSELPCLTLPKHEPSQDLPINRDPTTGKPLLPRQPVEVYVDPLTGKTKDDPSNPQSHGNDGTLTTHIFPIFFFPSPDRRDYFIAHLSEESTDVQAAWANADKQVVLFGANGVRATGLAKLAVTVVNAGVGSRVGFQLLAKPGKGAFGSSETVSTQQIPTVVGNYHGPINLGVNSFSPANILFTNPVSGALEWANTFETIPPVFGGLLSDQIPETDYGFVRTTLNENVFTIRPTIHSGLFFVSSPEAQIGAQRMLQMTQTSQIANDSGGFDYVYAQIYAYSYLVIVTTKRPPQPIIDIAFPISTSATVMPDSLDLVTPFFAAGIAADPANTFIEDFTDPWAS